MCIHIIAIHIITIYTICILKGRISMSDIKTIMAEAAEELHKLEHVKQTELTERSAHVDSLENRRAHLSMVMQRSLRDGDTAAYIAAKREVRDIDDEVDANRKRIELITNGDMVSGDEYSAFVRKIHDALDEENRKAAAAAAGPISELVRIADELDEAITNACRLIELWGAATNVTKTPKGRAIARQNAYGNRTLTNWVQNNIVNSEAIKELTGGANLKNWHGDDRTTAPVDWNPRAIRKQVTVPAPEEASGDEQSDVPVADEAQKDREVEEAK